jgi:hypothetical protein
MKKKQYLVVCMLLIATALVPTLGIADHASHSKITATPLTVTNNPVPKSAPTQIHQLSVTPHLSTAFAGTPVAATDDPDDGSGVCAANRADTVRNYLDVLSG